MTKHYLKPTVKIEPFTWGWYAWPYLIPPITAACNIVERHLKIMNSYIQNPQIHARAVQDPKLLGGPFVDLGGQKIQEIKALIEKTQHDCMELIHLNSAQKELNKILKNEAQGDMLEGFYNRIPAPLRGLVELVYDLNNQPSIRYIEPLIYKKYYKMNNQTIALSNITSDDRKFVLSTPRLSSENEVHLNLPFSSPELDEICKMREFPQDLKNIEDSFGLLQSEQKLFKTFFTDVSPPISHDRNYQGDGIRIRYFGHACVLVQTKSHSILLDPVISYPIDSSGIPRYTLADLPDVIDYVVITHNHQDHLMFETLLQLRHKIKHIIFPGNNAGALEDPSVKLILKHTGFKSLIELREMESHSLADGEITAIPFLGEHSDLNIQSKLSYCINLKGKQFLFAADSNNLDPILYDHILDVIGPIDMLFLGMECDGAPLTWLYGPLLTHPLQRIHDRNRTLSGSNFDKAWKIVEKLKCKQAYVYAMGQEPWLNYVMALKYSDDSIQLTESRKFVQACKQQGIESEVLFGRKEWVI